MDDTFEPWDAKKAGILAKYTTNEKLSIRTNIVDTRNAGRTTTVSDKVKTRLEELEDLEEGSIQEALDLSQQEWVEKINQLNNDLKAAWDQEQRVKALKIAIQVSVFLYESPIMINFLKGRFSKTQYIFFHLMKLA
jgi:hypothetical protein